MTTQRIETTPATTPLDLPKWSVLPTAAVVVIVAVCLVLRAATDDPSILIVAAVLAITYVQVHLLKKRTGKLVHPVTIIVCGVNLGGLGGYFVFPAIAGSAQVSAAIPHTPEVYNGAARIFVAASLALWAGGMITGRPTEVRRVAPTSAGRVMSTIPASRALLLGALPIALAVVGYGPHGLISRGHYLASVGPRFTVSAASMFAVVGVAILAFVLCDARRTFDVRLAAGVLLAIQTVVLFAIGTRQLALVPALIFFAWSQTGKRKGLRTVAAITAGIVWWWIQIPLNVRSTSDGAGLAPFLHRLHEHPELWYQSHPGPVLGNLLFGVPLTGQIALLRGNTLPMHTFVTSINPLPGMFTDWSTVNQNLGLNQFTPFNTLGELAGYGWAYVIGTMLVIGLVLGWAHRASAQLTPTMSTIATLALTGASAIYTCDLLQYNLRSGLRIVWYALALVVVMRLLSPRTGSGEGGERTAEGKALPVPEVTVTVATRTRPAPHR